MKYVKEFLTNHICLPQATSGKYPDTVLDYMLEGTVGVSKSLNRSYVIQTSADVVAHGEKIAALVFDLKMYYYNNIQ